MSESSFWKELQKRKVVHTAAIFVAVAWGATEIIVTVVEQLFLPQWVSTVTVIAFVVGFPVAMFLAWTFDITQEGIRRTTVTSRKGKASIVGAMVLLVAGTAGLFFLIRPSLEGRSGAADSVDILPNSIAILRFANASNDPDDAYLSDGISDELRDQLSRVSGLRVAARSSSIAVVENSMGAKTSSRTLGVAAIIEGSVRRRGNAMRVSVQLIEGATGLVIWSQTYDRSPRELLSVQVTIANEIVDHLLPGAEAPDIPAATRNVSAHELMLLARYYEQRVRETEEVDEETLLEAIRLYREAAEADPDSALVHSRLAGTLLYLGDVAGAEAPIFKALTLDPDLSEVQATLGSYYWARALPGAGPAWRRAVELNPNNADALALFAYWNWMETGSEKPDDLYRRALDLDPLSLTRLADLGNFLGITGNVEGTLEIIDRVEELFDDAPSYRVISRLLEYTGDIDHSIAWAIKARDLEPHNLSHVGQIAELFVDIGDFETAMSIDENPVGLLIKMRRYEEFIDIAEFLMIDQPHDMMIRYLLGFAYNATGNYEGAIRVLRSTGLPDILLEQTRQPADLEANITLIDAINNFGDVELAHDLAAWFESNSHIENDSWWIATMRACTFSIVGDDKSALEKIERIKLSVRLPWDSMLRDWSCLSRFENDPRYQDVLQHFEERRAALRERLPNTLAKHGVSLDQFVPK
jgi:TolB-like protein/tetratricopeptide (TPR) repeat protein